MIRLAFSTLGCPSWSLGRILESASRLGYDGVELRFIEGDDALWARPELTGSGLPETLARLADAGLAVPCVDTRSFFHAPDPPARRAALEEATRTAEVAARLESRRSSNGLTMLKCLNYKIQIGLSNPYCFDFVAAKSVK